MLSSAVMLVKSIGSDLFGFDIRRAPAQGGFSRLNQIATVERFAGVFQYEIVLIDELAAASGLFRRLPSSFSIPEVST
jgi:hypothetical protein